MIERISCNNQQDNTIKKRSTEREASDDELLFSLQLK